jgi:hypothetical protein
VPWRLLPQVQKQLVSECIRSVENHNYTININISTNGLFSSAHDINKIDDNGRTDTVAGDNDVVIQTKNNNTCAAYVRNRKHKHKHNRKHHQIDTINGNNRTFHECDPHERVVDCCNYNFDCNSHNYSFDCNSHNYNFDRNNNNNNNCSSFIAVSCRLGSKHFHVVIVGANNITTDRDRDRQQQFVAARCDHWWRCWRRCCIDIVGVVDCVLHCSSTTSTRQRWISHNVYVSVAGNGFSTRVFIGVGAT